MKVKTADLIGPALDWAVAKCGSVEVEYINDGITRCLLRVSPFIRRNDTDKLVSLTLCDLQVGRLTLA